MPDVNARIALARRELGRLEGHRSPAVWAELVEAWRALGAAYELAYAQLRLSEALLAGATPGGSARDAAANALAAAWTSTRTMQATPLVTTIESLARRARINLDLDGTADSPRDVGQPFALSSRELEVLRLVADGLSNGQIGSTLYISRKTASVHVSNILRKLGVRNRIEAATVAHRSQLWADARQRPAEGVGVADAGTGPARPTAS
jgi:DNA-binding CsgD family transcriptional regulator